jgi:hypothetical protein
MALPGMNCASQNLACASEIPTPGGRHEGMGAACFAQPHSREGAPLWMRDTIQLWMREQCCSYLTLRVAAT